MRYIATLFSGIGAPEQAGIRLGYKQVFACEWDKFARESFLANYDLEEAHFHKDVYDLDGTQYDGKVDILIGGSPCQAFSIAGLRKGLNDKRGELIYEYIRVVNEVKAPVIVYENVKGMMSIDGGRTIKEFVQALRDIGYHCHYSVLNSKDYGIPQNRERLFLVGFLDHEAYHAFSYAPKQKLTKRLRDVLESSVDEKYYLNKPIEMLTYKDEGIIGMLDIKGNESIRRVYGVDGNAPCLQTMQGGNREPKIFEDRTDGMRFFKDDCCGALRTTSECGDKRVLEHRIIQLNNPTFSQQRIYSIDGISPTIAEGNLGGGKEPCKHLTDDYRIRKLTPRECLRLQDFPDTFKQVVSDSQMYKQACNSMTVAVLEMIFIQIEKALNGKCENLFGETA